MPAKKPAPPAPDTRYRDALVEAFRELLHKNRLKAPAVAARAGMKPQQARRIMTGRVNPTWDSVMRLVEAAGGEIAIFSRDVSLSVRTTKDS